jgi:LmbE family N-acetylglucosaminyl deacetylase
VDCRQDPDPRQRLARLRAQEDVQVWRETGASQEIMGQDRYGLGASGGLAIWTTPPGLSELRAVLERVSPETVYLFAIDPGLDHPEAFLACLAGLTKHALNARDGRVSIAMLAAATAQREATVRVGLMWLVARGHLTVLDEDGDEVHLAAGSQAASTDLPQATARLTALLEETAAYRAHFARADKETLIVVPDADGGKA